MYGIDEVNSMDELVKAASKSFLLTKEEFIAEACETALDSVLDIIGIPIAGVLKPFAKVSLALRERNLMRNTVYFLQGFQTGIIEEDKLSAYKEKLFNDQEFCEQEIGRILILLDSTVETIRAKIIGCLYMNLVNQRISPSEFCEFSELTNRLYNEDFKALYKDPGELEEYRLDRMKSAGLIKEGPVIRDRNNNGNVEMTNECRVTRFGRRYRELIEAVVVI